MMARATPPAKAEKCPWLTPLSRTPQCHDRGDAVQHICGEPDQVSEAVPRPLRKIPAPIPSGTPKTLAMTECRLGPGDGIGHASAPHRGFGTGSGTPGRTNQSLCRSDSQYRSQGKQYQEHCPDSRQRDQGVEAAPHDAAWGHRKISGEHHFCCCIRHCRRRTARYRPRNCATDTMHHNKERQAQPAREVKVSGSFANSLAITLAVVAGSEQGLCNLRAVFQSPSWLRHGPPSTPPQAKNHATMMPARALRNTPVRIISHRVAPSASTASAAAAEPRS